MLEECIIMLLVLTTEDAVHYDFDTIIKREGTNAIKWDWAAKITGHQNLLPFWVADMEIPAPPEISAALKERADHGIYGYTYTDNELFDAFIQWRFRRDQWQIEKSSILYAPSVIPAMHASVEAFSEPGDEIIIQPPVYQPFFSIVKQHQRRLVLNPLRNEGGRYKMDFSDLVEKISSKTKLLFLCNPHNPVGRVWEEEELQELLSICLKNNIMIISDEIHGDLILNGRQFISMGGFEEGRDNVISFFAPNKTFNIPGLPSSFVVQTPKLKTKLRSALEKTGAGLPNIMSVIAAETAYRHCDKWLDQLLRYIEQNFHMLNDLINTSKTDISLLNLEGTYLCWLDFRETGLSEAEIKRRLYEEAKIWLSEGSYFGVEGEGYMRMNIACPIDFLEEGCRRMIEVFER